MFPGAILFGAVESLFLLIGICFILAGFLKLIIYPLIWIGGFAWLNISLLLDNSPLYDKIIMVLSFCLSFVLAYTCTPDGSSVFIWILVILLFFPVVFALYYVLSLTYMVVRVAYYDIKYKTPPPEFERFGLKHK